MAAKASQACIPALRKSGTYNETNIGRHRISSTAGLESTAFISQYLSFPCHYFEA